MQTGLAWGTCQGVGVGWGRMQGDWVLGRGKIAEMGVVVHEGCGLAAGARLGDKDLWDL